MRIAIVECSQHSILAFIFVLSSAILSSCIITSDPDGPENIQGSGLLETQTIEVIDFSRVSMSIPGELVIKQGLEESLVLSAQANLLPYIKVFVDEDQLRIETPERTNLEPTRTILVELTVKSMKELTFAGDGLVEIDTLATTSLSVTLTGSGDIEINQLSSVLLDATLAGSGDMLFSGVVDEQNIVLAGSGNIEARELESNKADIEIAGSGAATINVRDELRASIVGSGSVRYLGNPVVDVTIVGSGTVTPLN